MPVLVVGSRHALASEALAHILLTADQESVLAGCHLRLYLYDEDRGRLVPVLLPDESRDDVADIEEWEVGTGATGTAYQRGEFVLAEGSAVWDTTHGLTEEQSTRFRHLTAVASMPVTNAASEVLAVMTAATSEPGGGHLGTDEAYEALIARSLLVARILVDLLGWFPDSYGESDE